MSHSSTCVVQQAHIHTKYVTCGGGMQDFYYSCSGSLFLCSVFGQSWKGVRDQVQSESLQRSHIITTVEEKVVQPLQVFLLSDLEKRFRHVSNTLH